MRPYRGLTKDDKWIYGWLVEIVGKSYIVLLEATLLHHLLPIPYTRLVEVSPETVGQQVGKQDIKIQEIYEGDIIIWDIKQVGVWPGQDKPEVVKYPFVCGNTHLGKIIGNIHQHPELEGGAK